jgi:hypothetical protein
MFFLWLRLGSIWFHDYHQQDFYHTWLWATWRIFITNMNCLSFVSTSTHPSFVGGVSVTNLFSFLCCVFLICVLCPVQLVSSLDCRFWIELSVFPSDILLSLVWSSVSYWLLTMFNVKLPHSWQLGERRCLLQRKSASIWCHFYDH